MEEYKDKKVKVRLRGVGKKGIAFFKFQDIELHTSYVGVSSAPTYEKAQEIIKEAVEDFMNGVTDKVILIHNGYLNMISQELKVNNIVPVSVPESYESDSKSLMELEPEEDETILESLMKKYFEYNMYYSLIDSLAAEHSARMQAMENATKNATERVDMLTLAYNKARQESITTELIEIISGVESMK
jgi:F-type H+-transporting ATPase subunit gamma